MRTVGQILRGSQLPEGSNRGCSLSVGLRQLLTVSTELVQRMFAAVRTLSSHFIQTAEMSVPHNNPVVVDKGTNITNDTVKARILVL